MPPTIAPHYHQSQVDSLSPSPPTTPLYRTYCSPNHSPPTNHHHHPHLQTPLTPHTSPPHGSIPPPSKHPASLYHTSYPPHLLAPIINTQLHSLIIHSQIHIKPHISPSTPHRSTPPPSNHPALLPHQRHPLLHRGRPRDRRPLSPAQLRTPGPCSC